MLPTLDSPTFEPCGDGDRNDGMDKNKHPAPSPFPIMFWAVKGYASGEQSRLSEV